MRRIHLIRAEYTPRSDHSDRKSALLHLVNLYARGLRAEQNIAVDIERVLLVFCRMICRNIQRLKVVVILLHLRPLHNLIAHSDKYTLYLL